DRGEQFPCGEQVERVLGGGGGFRRLWGRTGPAVTEGGPAGRCVQPRRESTRGVQRARLADEMTKRGLAGGVRRIRGDPDASTDSKAGGGVPAEDGFEVLRVAGVEVAAAEFGIARCRSRDVHQPVDRSGEEESRHGRASGLPSRAVLPKKKRRREARPTWEK